MPGSGPLLIDFFVRGGGLVERGGERQRRCCVAAKFALLSTELPRLLLLESGPVSIARAKLASMVTGRLRDGLTLRECMGHDELWSEGVEAAEIVYICRVPL